MARSLVTVVVLTFLITDLRIGKVNGFFFCDKIADIANTLIFGNKIADFYMYTNSSDNPQKISCHDKCDMKNVKFNPNLRTTVIIHGFKSDHTEYWIQSLIDELFKWQDMNIIVVDWAEFFNINYYKSAIRVSNIAMQVHRMLETLAETSNKDLKDWPYLHFIGHSLGAHVAGQAAKLLKEKVLVHRVSALDPAKPYFEDKGADLKLDKANAKFVDVIHTNSEPDEETFGLYEPLGHVDFYPNGGDRQPECSNEESSEIAFRSLRCLSELIFGLNIVSLKKNYLWRKLHGNDMICDHGAGQNYFIESINRQSKHIAKKVPENPEDAETGCADESCIGHGCVPMGMHSVQYNDTRYHGAYFVDTKCASSSASKKRW